MTQGFDTGFLVAAEVQGHPEHAAARSRLAEMRSAGDRFALAPQVLAEFVHVVTDPKRFTEPLTMEAAIERAEVWWNSPEVDPLAPEGEAVRQFFAWMRAFRLGRKRVLDTLLAATFHEAGIASVLTTNARDFAVLGGFACITPTAAV